MQVDPMKPTLKAPGSQRLKLIRDRLVSSLAFKSNLRRYTKDMNLKLRRVFNKMQRQQLAGAFARWAEVLGENKTSANLMHRVMRRMENRCLAVGPGLYCYTVRPPLLKETEG